MSRIFLSTSLLLFSALMLVACAAPSAPEPATGNLAGSTPPPPPVPPTKPAPPMSSPTPPRPDKDVVAVVTTCKTNADCAVKNVGNCCGAMPACVNKDSPTDPAAVQAQCAAKGMMSTCGFAEISSCQCDNGQCAPAGDGRRLIQ
ncbi:MAG: hypothetical protein ABWZ08_08615 [Pseudoxanthomonas sp.]